MRVAVTTGLLRVPPTYFVAQHAERFGDRATAEVFAAASEVRDAPAIPVHDASPEWLPWSLRQYAALAALTAQERAITRFAPDVVHQHFATWATGAASAAARCQAPLVVTLHGYDVFADDARGSLGVIHRRSLRMVRARAARFLAVSRYLADEAIARGFPAERLDVLYQGVDTDFFRPSTAASSGGEPTVVYVGALSEGKGVRDLVAASRRLAASVPHRVVFIGGGPLDDWLRAEAALTPHLVLRGAQPRDAVRAALQHADVGVLPTGRFPGGRREAAGLALLEAQACGLPVVTYASGGAAEMLDDGITGAVVPPGDTAALGVAIGDLLSVTGAARERLAVACRAFVVRERSVSGATEQLLGIYEKLVG